MTASHGWGGGIEPKGKLALGHGQQWRLLGVGCIMGLKW